jgi:small-conductance mechanosensitive channel
MNEIWNSLSEFWNFQLFTVDGQALTLGTLVFGATILLVGLGTSGYVSRKFARRILSRFVADKAVTGLVQTLSFYLLAIFWLILALKIAHIPMTAFTLVGGALAIGVGFGSQNLVSNFISGVILLLERPVKAGDFLAVDGNFGQVDSIGMRSTVINLTGNRQLILPNRWFLDQPLINWTLADNAVRVPLSIGVAYGSDISKVKALLLRAAQEEPEVLRSEDSLVLFEDFADNALIFELRVWIRIREVIDRKRVLSQLRFRIDDLFRRDKVVIAFPQRDLHLHQDSALRVSLER